MPQARRPVLMGVFLALALCAGLATYRVRVWARSERDAQRLTTEGRVKATLEHARIVLRHLEAERALAQQAAWQAYAARDREILLKATRLLSLAVARHAEAQAPPSQEASAGLRDLLALLGLLPDRAPPTGGGISALAILREEGKALTELLPAGGARLRVTAPDGTVLWEAERPFASQPYSDPLAETLAFAWGNRQERWIFSLSTALPDLPGPLTGPELVAGLGSDSMLRAQIEDSVCLALVDREGNTLLSLPKGGESPGASGAMPGAWSLSGEGGRGDVRARYLGEDRPREGNSYRILAQATIPEPSLFHRALAAVKREPGLLLVPGGILLASILVLSWALLSANRPSEEPEKTAPRSLRLVRKGERAVPEDTKVLFAEIREDGSPIRVRPVKGAVYPAADRPSNITRLRALYGDEPAVAPSVMPQVRSEVLRTLLRRVGPPAGEEEKPDV
ncbi:MAG: hypothetical protein V1918_00155 [Planctomycetota bacterium]